MVPAVGVLHGGGGLGAFGDQVRAAAPQVARGAHAGRIALGLRRGAAAEQAGALGGGGRIVLALAAVNGFPVQGRAENGGQLLLGAAVGEPVPAGQALDGDGPSVAAGCDGLAGGVGFGGAVLVGDDLAVATGAAQVPGPGVQIGAAVESVRLVGEAPGVLPRSRWGPEPAWWLEGASLLEIPR